MKIGTRLTTTTVWHPETTYIEEFIGKEDGYYLIQNYKLLDDGSSEVRNKVGYDEKGRKVFSTLDGKTNTYTPYSCQYVIGKCTHTYKYYNSLTKKYVTNEGKYDNRLDGDTLYVGVITFDGSMYEVPFELGPHKLRMSSEYKNALGKPTGFKFVDLAIP
ncbi:MAG: hypothetical protein ACR2QW_14695 [bacterium]